jgi:hypothetical protein
VRKRKTHLNDGRILLATFYELFVGELCVLVSIHVSEYLVHTLLDVVNE